MKLTRLTSLRNMETLMSHSVGDSMPFVLECVSCFRIIRLISLSGLAAIGMAIIVIPTAEAVAAVQDQSIEISA
ncbi:MAG: hypothetical protein ACK526_10590, partial [Planctomyces sp.]